MEIKITFEIGEKTIELIKKYFASKEEKPTVDPINETALKLAAILTEVKALTKNGKGKYVKDLLLQFDASRVSELDETDYDEFYKQLRTMK